MIKGRTGGQHGAQRRRGAVLLTPNVLNTTPSRTPVLQCIPTNHLLPGLTLATSHCRSKARSTNARLSPRLPLSSYSILHSGGLIVTSTCAHLSQRQPPPRATQGDPQEEEGKLCKLQYQSGEFRLCKASGWHSRSPQVPRAKIDSCALHVSSPQVRQR